MKIFLLAIILFIPAWTFGQERPKAVLIDEFGRPCNEELLARFDNFISQRNEIPDAHSYIYFYGDYQLEGRNLSFVDYLKGGYHRLESTPERQFRFVQGGNLSEMKLQFWLVPPGAEMPPISPKYTPPAEIKRPVLFDKGWADFHRWYGPTEIYSMGFYDLGCDFPPNDDAFAKLLLADASLRGHLIIYTSKEHGAKRGNAVARFAIKDLIDRFGLQRNRITFAYGGKRDEPEIELWLIPKGSHDLKALGKKRTQQ